jgi:phosphatidylinositol-3-phosphatase
VRALPGVALAVLAAAALSGSAAGARQQVPQFDHVVVVVLENKSEAQILGSRRAPRFNAFASRYAVLSRYSGVAHPSLPNYLGLVSGSTHGIRSDCTGCVVSARNLADTLEEADLSWKAYAEGLPRPGFTGSSTGRYVKRHVPFLYFRDVLADPARRRHVVPLGRLSRDLAGGNLPAFSLVIPDLCHDMHDCPVVTGDSWLGRFLPPLLRSPELAGSVIFVVTDETSKARVDDPVPALALGPLVVPGSRFAGRTSHYGLLRTIEDAWDLSRLGRSARAKPITRIWR